MKKKMLEQIEQIHPDNNKNSSDHFVSNTVNVELSPSKFGKG